MGFGASGLGSRVSGFGFRVSGIGNWVSGFGSRVCLGESVHAPTVITGMQFICTASLDPTTPALNPNPKPRTFTNPKPQTFKPNPKPRTFNTEPEPDTPHGHATSPRSCPFRSRMHHETLHTELLTLSSVKSCHLSVSNVDYARTAPSTCQSIHNLFLSRTCIIQRGQGRTASAIGPVKGALQDVPTELFRKLDMLDIPRVHSRQNAGTT